MSGIALLLAACGGESQEVPAVEGDEVLRDSRGRELGSISEAPVRTNPESAVGVPLLARIEVQPNELIEFYEMAPGQPMITGAGAPDRVWGQAAVRKKLGVVLLGAALWGCGGNVHDPGEGGSMGTPEPDVPDDCTLGAERPATKKEKARTCKCKADDVEQTFWVCYGSPPGSVMPAATCSSPFIQEGDAACLFQYGDCTNEKIYGVSCVERLCYCLIDGEPVAELEPSDTCPASASELNTLCSWALVEE